MRWKAPRKRTQRFEVSNIGKAFGERRIIDRADHIAGNLALMSDRGKSKLRIVRQIAAEPAFSKLSARVCGSE